MDNTLKLYENASGRIINTRIKLEAYYRGVSLKDLSAKIGKTPQYLSIMFSREVKLPYKVVLDVAAALGVPVGNILTELENPTVDDKISRISAQCRRNERFCDLCYNLALADNSVLTQAFNTLLSLCSK